MATREGSNPLQQFIENQMFLTQFMQEQRKQFFNEESTNRQLETQELGTFMELAQQTQRPEALEALVNVFASRNEDKPEFAASFREMASQIAPTLAVQQAGVVRAGVNNMDPGMRAGLEQGSAFSAFVGAQPGSLSMDSIVNQLSPEAKRSAVAISQGRELSAAERGNLDAEAARLGVSIDQLNEGIRQHGINTREGQLDREQRGALGQLNASVAAGLAPWHMLNERSEIRAQLVDHLQAQPQSSVGSPEYGQILEQLTGHDLATDDLQRFWDDQFGKDTAAGGLTLHQLISGRQAALSAINDAGRSDPAARRTAIENYNLITGLLSAQGVPGQSGLTMERNWFTGWIPGIPEHEVNTVPLPSGIPQR